MMRVGLYGGSFSPVHIGHLVIAEQARVQARLDRVVWMPAFLSPHKTDRAAPAAAHRLAMCRLATVGHDAFEVSDLEIEREGVSFTVDTLRSLRDSHPDWDLHLVIGQDSLESFPTWKEPDTILSMARLVVYPRAAEPDLAGLLAAVQADAIALDAPRLAVSASDIRDRIGRGLSVRYLLPDRVLSYVEDHGLYR